MSVVPSHDLDSAPLARCEPPGRSLESAERAEQIRSATPSPPTTPFDALAESYDQDFSHTVLGRLLREAVWRRLEQRFAPGDRVLELNCGTGEDAVFLARLGVQVVATDVSAQMLIQTAKKVAAAGVAEQVAVQRLALEDLAVEPHGPFAGVLSNFGGLNCVGDLTQVAQGIARVLAPGGAAVLCVMGPYCPWEWLWYLPRGEWRKAFRRQRPGGVVWRGLRIQYPSISQVQRAMAPWFELERTAALGALLPPPYAASWLERRARWLEQLNRYERRWETCRLLTWCADHYLLELVRR